MSITDKIIAEFERLRGPQKIYSREYLVTVTSDETGETITVRVSEMPPNQIAGVSRYRVQWVEARQAALRTI